MRPGLTWGHSESTKSASTSGTVLQVYDFVMYGDSILEGFRGTVIGRPVGRVKENMLAWETFFKPSYNATVFAIAGEEVSPILRQVATALHCCTLVAQGDLAPS